MAKAKAAPKKNEAPRSIQNRRARFDYAISETVEAGLALVGTEVKSVFQGRVNLTDAYCKVVNGEMWLLECDIEPYEHTTAYHHDRRRDRKCLLHRREIDVLQRKALEKGFALLPLAMYFKNGRVKLEIGLGRGKKEYDKRDTIAKKESQREVERARSGKW